MQKVKLGVIGLGWVAQVFHLPTLKKFSEVEISCICDKDKSRARAIAEKYGIKKYYTDYEEMLRNEELNAVDICTTTDTHEEISIAALENKMDVFVEKPITRKYSEAVSIMETVKKTKQKLMVGMNHRFRPDTMLLRSFIENNELGKIFYVKTGWLKKPTPDNTWLAKKSISGGGAFLDLGMLMSQMGESVMEKIGLVGSNTGIYLNETPSFGRMLYYRKNEESAKENPYWCGAHFDHGLFTALLPAFYFFNGELIPEPIEAGLFVKTTLEGEFKKVVSNDPDVLLFQVGEFAQLLTNDVIRATEHRVHKAEGSVERYTMALFFDVPMDTIIHSFSELTQDERYGGEIGAPCSYNQWSEASFNRYLVKDEEEGSASKN